MDRLLTEAETARYAGVSLGAMQRARRTGKIVPKQEALTGVGTVRFYDGDEIKAYFENSAEYQANRRRCAKKAPSSPNSFLQAINPGTTAIA